MRDAGDLDQVGAMEMENGDRLKMYTGSRMVLDEGLGMGRKGKEEWMTPKTLAGCFVSGHVVPVHGPCLLFSVF